jgi:1-acyl-sn-glycerol-3-phosphate acyltransferase
VIDGVSRAAMDRTLRRGVAGVWVRGAVPAGPAVWAGNHHSWWDPFVAAAALRRAGSGMALLVSPSNLDAYRFARHVGAFPADRPREGLAALRAGRSLVVYPEGRLGPAGPPGPLARGASWFARKAAVPLVATAVRVLPRGGQWPQVYLHLREVDVAAGGRPAGSDERATGELWDTLAALLAGIDSAAGEVDPALPLPGFRLAVRGRSSWDERIDALRGVPWRRH